MDNVAPFYSIFSKLIRMISFFVSSRERTKQRIATEQQKKKKKKTKHQHKYFNNKIKSSKSANV